MKRMIWVFAVCGLIGASLAGGYWWGTTKSMQVAEIAAAAPHKPVGDTGSAAQAALPRAAPDGGKGRILYYRNPMGLPDTSPVPKKDPMGMDYVPVYEGDEPQGPGVKVTLDKVQKLGVRTEAAALRNLTRTVRAVGTVEVDERMLRTVAPRFEGWIQRLHVNTTGQLVRRGQALMEVYSPDLVAAQQEYVVATTGVARLKDASPEFQASMRSLVEGSLQRLRNWDIAEEELARLREEGKPTNALTLRSPASGVVLEKPSVQGMRFMPGEMLYKIADLSSVWLIADVFEQDLGLIRPGQSASVRVNAYPDRTFKGRVAFVYPTVTPETRTGKVRIEMANAGKLLKPAMYANVELSSAQAARRLTVPDTAILDSGTRQLVLVQRGQGLFEPRDVRLGLRGDGYAEVLEGIKQGEEVVVSANFLIDAESNLKAAVAGFGQSAPAQGGRPKLPPRPGSTHTAEGTVEKVDALAGTVSIAHGAVASLKWPAMTMEFKVKDQALLRGLKAGARIRFEFAEESSGVWALIRGAPLAGAPGSASKAAERDAHQGH